MADRIRRYRDFWPYYLGEHADRRSRALHYVGSSLALLAICLALATGDARWLIAAALAGYGFAWFGHLVLERNRPATFRYPLWSLASDFRMLALWVTGRLPRHLRQAGLN